MVWAIIALRPIIIGMLILSGGSMAGHAQEPADDWVYLENNTLRLGVKRSSGAGIAYLSEAGSTSNLLNHYDRGRLVQQSYYGESDGSYWGQEPWRYNPVQGGEYQGQGARVVELRHDARSLYAKTIPRHWASGGELPECTMEEWITLEAAWAHVRFQFTYRGTMSHASRHQEIPAIFVEAAFGTMAIYDGSAPWTGAALTRLSPGLKNEYHKMTEHWVAYLNSEDFGIGACVPIASELTCYCYKGAPGTECSYVAPLATFALTPGLVFSYDAYLAIGKVEELRTRFRNLAHSPP